MPILDLTAAHVAQMMGAFEPQRGNNGLLRINLLNQNVTGPKGESIVTLALNSFSLPAVVVEQMEIAYLNERRKMAGAVNFENIEVSFRDYVDVPVAQVLKTWHEQVYNPATGAIGLAANYKKPGLIELFAPDGSMSRYYTLVGVWPVTFNPGQIDMGSSEPVMISMSLSIDKAFAANSQSLANLLVSKAISAVASAVA